MSQCSAAVWMDRVRVRLAVIQDETTDNLDAPFERSARGDGRPDGDFPEMRRSVLPTDLVLPSRRGRYAVSAGLRFCCRSGREWEADWLFRPGIPERVREIEVVAHTASGEQAVSVSLACKTTAPDSRYRWRAAEHADTSEANPTLPKDDGRPRARDRRVSNGCRRYREMAKQGPDRAPRRR
jgi:hypothetical protein